MRGGTARRRLPRAAGALAAAFLLAALLPRAGAPLGAQGAAPRAALRLEAPPHHAEVPIEGRIVIEGFEEQPVPEVVPLAEPEGATLEIAGISPQISSSMSIVNGKVSQSRTVVWSVDLRILAGAPGRVRLPPIEVRQGGRTLRVEGQELLALAIPPSEEIAVEIELPERPLYLGQRATVRVRMLIDDRLAEAIAGYALRSELFDREADFDFIDAEPVRGGQTLDILAGGSRLRLPAEATRVPRGGRAWIEVAAERILVPLRAGTFELRPATLVLEEVTRWQRGGLFPMERRAAETRLHLARDLPRRLVVRELPTSGRPGSFAGAVGRGFTLSLETDRSVVRAGDPIVLTLTLRGDGNLENAGLPPLPAAGLPAAFQVGEGTPAGILGEGEKVFRVPVRVRDESVREIPPLEYAWFDPEAEGFRTTRTEPIALSVRAGETVGAEDVIGAAGNGSEDTDGADPAPAEGSAGLPRFTLVGADLAIETDPARLAVVERARFGGAALRIAIYALSGLLVAGAVALRTRDRIPAAVRDRRARLAARVGEIDEAASAAGSGEGLERVATLLRSMQREVRAAGGGAVEGLDELLAACEERIYAPRPDAAGAAELGERARALARRLEEAGR